MTVDHRARKAVVRQSSIILLLLAAATLFVPAAVGTDASGESRDRPLIQAAWHFMNASGTQYDEPEFALVLCRMGAMVTLIGLAGLVLCLPLYLRAEISENLSWLARVPAGALALGAGVLGVGLLVLPDSGELTAGPGVGLVAGFVLGLWMVHWSMLRSEFR